MGHAPFFTNTVPVGSCMEASLAAHIYLVLGAVFVASSRGFQSIRCCVSLFKVGILFQHSSREGEKRERSMESDNFVEILFPWSVLCSPIELIGTLE